VAAEGADLELIVDPFGDFDEDIYGDEGDGDGLDGDMSNNIVDHLGRGERGQPAM
jgi:hypothetical protein